VPRLDYNRIGELPIDGVVGARLRSSALKFEHRGRMDAREPICGSDEMREYPLDAVEAMVANGCSLGSIEDFIEDRTHLSEEVRSALWLVAWIETGREHRRRRVAELIEGSRQLAGRVGARRRVECSWADESVARRNEFGLGIGA